MTDEEQRAANYRAQERREIVWERENAIRLRGSDAAFRALKAKWQPLIDALKERRDHERTEEERHDRTRWSG